MQSSESSLLAALRRVTEAGTTLSPAEAQALLEHFVDEAESATPDTHLQLAALLGAMAARGETAAELLGFVRVLRQRVTPIPLSEPERTHLVDTCGTGGDGSGTFNISTAAALVAAAAGVQAGAPLMVAKHGNRAVTSRSGSADVLEALGIPVDHTPAGAAEALQRHRFAFLSAPALHPAMRAVLPVRRALRVRSAFNVVGPMINPAGARNQVMGVFAARLVPVVAEALAALGTGHALVVHGGGLDELALHAPTEVAEVRGHEVRLRTLTPADFSLRAAPLDALAGGDAHTNAAILRSIFAGEPGPPRDVVVMNASAVLLTAGAVRDLREGALLAEQAIDSGAVQRIVRALAAS